MILRETVQPYPAARAVLRLIKHGRFALGALQGQAISEVVHTVAFPGLGTGVGRVLVSGNFLRPTKPLVTPGPSHGPSQSAWQVKKTLDRLFKETGGLDINV